MRDENYPPACGCSGQSACECVGACACGNIQCQNQSGGIYCGGPTSRRETSMLLATVQQQQKQIDALEKQVAELKKR